MSLNIRNKRFKPKKDRILKFEATLPSDEVLTGEIQNISQYGASVHISSDDLQVNVGEFLSEAVISDKNQKFHLQVGRLLVCRASKSELGVKAVDGKFPIDSILSSHLESFGKKSWDVELDPEKFTIKDFSIASNSERDLFAKVEAFGVMFNEWQSKPQYQYKTVRTASMGTKTSLKGVKKKTIVMGSNDYLNLSAHPKVIEAAIEATKKYGTSSTGSPLTTGQTDIHMELCDFLAKMFKKESAILFNSGYASNLGGIQGLIGSEDVMIADFLSHASIQDGMKQSNGTTKLFRHNNLKDLNRILENSRDNYAGAVVLTEGVFSMDGDTPPLIDIIKEAKKHDCRLYLDEAHSIGVLGPNGGGLVEELNCHDDIDIIMGTFSKSFGGIGGFIASSEKVCNWLYWLSRSHMFSISISPANAAAALTAGKLFSTDLSIIEKLHKNIRHFVDGMRNLGAPIAHDHPSTVVPIVVGDIEKLGIMNKYLLNNGVFVVPIVYPAVSRKSSRFRFTVCADLHESEIDYVLLVFKNAMKEADFEFCR